MQKKLFRILSVFLAVVIVSVCFMQPLAYANPIAVGGGALVLLVAGLLITCGMVFTSQAQAEAVSNYVISAMPSALREEFDNAIHVNFPDHWGEGGGDDGGGDPDPKIPKFRSFVTGFASSVAIGTTLYIQFKEWFDETFGVNEETAAAGEVSLSSSVGLTGQTIDIIYEDGTTYHCPVYDYNSGNDKDRSGSIQLNQSFSIGGTYFDYSLGDFYPENKNEFANQTYILYDNSISMERLYLNCAIDYGVHFKLVKRSNNLYIRFFYRSHFKSDAGTQSEFITDLNTYFPIMPFGSSDNSFVGINSEAWAYFHDYDNDTITYALASEIDEMFNRKYSEITDDYSFGNWDYNADLETLIDMIDGVSADLDKANDYGSLLEQYEALQNEVGNLRGVVADQGADAVGGVSPLDDAMYEVAKLLESIQDLIDDKEQDADKIRDLEKAVEDAKEAIKEMIPRTDPNPDPDPNPNPNPDPDLNPNPNPDPDLNPNPNPDPDPNPNPNPDPDPNPNPNPDPDPNPNPNPDPDPNPDGKIDWDILRKINTFDIFPFCLPKDVYTFFTVLAAPPKEPVFEVDIFNGKYNGAGKIVLDFKRFEEIRKLVRFGFLIFFIIGLMAATKKYIWTGGG